MLDFQGSFEKIGSYFKTEAKNSASVQNVKQVLKQRGKTAMKSFGHFTFLRVLFWSIINSGEVLNKLKSRGFRATSLSTYSFLLLLL